MDATSILSIISIATSALLAFALYQMNKQDKAIDDLRNTLNAVIAGQPNTYARRDDLSKLSDALFARLDRIEDKIDRKADKP